METALEKIAEGKTKIIWAHTNNNQVIVEDKGDTTRGNGAEHATIPGKAAWATQTTSNCFQLLHEAKIPNHFVEQQTDTRFLAQKLGMIPLELVVRRFAYGSYVKRNPGIAERARFAEPVFEMFSKDDDLNDPYIELDLKERLIRRYRSHEPTSPESLIDKMSVDELPHSMTEERASTVRRLAIVTFKLLEEAWQAQGVTLVDLKVECGVTIDGTVVIGDVIDNDSLRIWDRDGELLNKPPLSDLDKVADTYRQVAEATNRFSLREL